MLGVRFADRMGKGLRTSPRDALLAASAATESRGLCFGFHRGADTAGACVGLTAVAAIIYVSQGWSAQLQETAFRQLILVAAVPGLLAVALLARVRDALPKPPPAGRSRRSTRPLDRRFKLFLAAAGLFALANSSDAFLLLRAQNLGLSVFAIAGLLAAFNLVYSLIAPIAGRCSDSTCRSTVVVVGWCIYAGTYLGFGLARESWHVWALFGLYALYYGVAEGTARALVADLVPDEQRGTAYGLYSAIVGFAALPASLMAGLVWQGLGGWTGWGASAPFILGSALAATAVVVLLLSVGRTMPSAASHG